MSRKQGKHCNWKHTQKYSIALTPDQYIGLNEKAVFDETTMAVVVRDAIKESLLRHHYHKEFEK
jgi:hypothetical protein